MKGQESSVRLQGQSFTIESSGVVHAKGQDQVKMNEQVLDGWAGPDRSTECG